MVSCVRHSSEVPEPSCGHSCHKALLEVFIGMGHFPGNNNNVRSSIRNIGCLQIFSSLLGSWRGVGRGTHGDELH
jgi:hypothetical protein